MGNIVAVVDDLFFAAKIQEVARQVGATVETAQARALTVEALREKNPALVIIDLNATSADTVELIRQIKASAALASVPIIAFLSHVQVERMRAAQEAGCEQVLPRSKFSATLPELLRQFAAIA